MHCDLRARAPHWSLIASMWLLTAASLFHLPLSGYGLLLSALLCFISNALAIVLLFSPARADKIHGGIKLALQICFVGFFVIMMFRNPLLMQSLTGLARQLAP